jgi:MFS family permease
VTVVLPLVQGREQDWPLWSWLCFAAAPVLFLAFTAYQRQLKRRGGEPLVDMALFRERAFSVGLFVTAFLYASTASFFLVLSLYLQQGHGLSAMSAGLISIPTAAGFLVAGGAAPALTVKLGRQVLAIGAVALIAGAATLIFTVTEIDLTGEAWWLAPGLVICGLGMGLIMAPLPGIVLAGVSPQHAASASGVITTGQEVGAALGVAIIGVVFFGILGEPVQLDQFPWAIEASLIAITGLSAVLALLVQLLPRIDKEKAVSLPPA